MHFLRKLMLLILVVCTLGYSSAWAFDEHTRNNEVFHVSDADVLLNEGSEPINDHCGHVFSHLVGLFSELNFLFKKTSFFVYPSFSGRFVSFIPSIYLRPPNV